MAGEQPYSLDFSFQIRVSVSSIWHHNNLEKISTTDRRLAQPVRILSFITIQINRDQLLIDWATDKPQITHKTNSKMASPNFPIDPLLLQPDNNNSSSTTSSTNQEIKQEVPEEQAHVEQELYRSNQTHSSNYYLLLFKVKN